LITFKPGLDALFALASALAGAKSALAIFEVVKDIATIIEKTVASICSVFIIVFLILAIYQVS
jgi:hypothetical protein